MNHKIKQLNAKPNPIAVMKTSYQCCKILGMLEDLHELWCIIFLGVDVARRVTLVVAFDFLPQILGGDGNLQIVPCLYMNAYWEVGTLKP